MTTLYSPLLIAESKKKCTCEHKDRKSQQNSTPFAQAQTTVEVRVGDDGQPVSIPFESLIADRKFFKLTKAGHIKVKQAGLYLMHYSVQASSPTPEFFPLIEGGLVKSYFLINDTAVPLTARVHTFTAANQLAILHSHTIATLNEQDVITGYLSATPRFGIAPTPANGVDPGGSSATLTITPLINKPEGQIRWCTDLCEMQRNICLSFDTPQRCDFQFQQCDRDCFRACKEGCNDQFFNCLDRGENLDFCRDERAKCLDNCQIP